MLNKNTLELGQRVRMMRERKGWSQQELAGRMPGVKQQSIDHLEQGRVRWPRYLPELAETLGVREEWLRTGEGRMSPSSRRDGSGKELDPGLVTDVILGVEKGLKLHKLRLDDEEKALLVGALCELALRDEGIFGGKVAATIDNIIRYEQIRRRKGK